MQDCVLARAGETLPLTRADEVELFDTIVFGLFRLDCSNAIIKHSPWYRVLVAVCVKSLRIELHMLILRHDTVKAMDSKCCASLYQLCYLCVLQSCKVCLALETISVKYDSLRVGTVCLFEML